MRGIYSKMTSCHNCQKWGRLIEIEAEDVWFDEEDNYVDVDVNLCLPCLKKAVKILEDYDLCI
jgi:hypothetical protein